MDELAGGCRLVTTRSCRSTEPRMGYIKLVLEERATILIGSCRRDPRRLTILRRDTA